MRAQLLALALATSTPACTVTFGYIGNRSAHSTNAEARAKGKPETASPGTRTFVGLVCGLLIDALIISALVDNATGNLN